MALLPPGSTPVPVPGGLAQADCQQAGPRPHHPSPTRRETPVPAPPGPASSPAAQVAHYLFLHLNTKRFSTGTTQEGLRAGRETHRSHTAARPRRLPHGGPQPAKGGAVPNPGPAWTAAPARPEQAPEKGAEAMPPARPTTAQVAPVRAEGWVWGAVGPDPESPQKTASWPGREGQNDLAIPGSGLQWAGEAWAAGGWPLSSCTGRARPRSR